jgi:hypothetical protein
MVRLHCGDDFVIRVCKVIYRLEEDAKEMSHVATRVTTNPASPAATFICQILLIFYLKRTTVNSC